MMVIGGCSRARGSFLMSKELPRRWYDDVEGGACLVVVRRSRSRSGGQTMMGGKQFLLGRRMDMLLLQEAGVCSSCRRRGWRRKAADPAFAGRESIVPADVVVVVVAALMTHKGSHSIRMLAARGPSLAARERVVELVSFGARGRVVSFGAPVGAMVVGPLLRSGSRVIYSAPAVVLLRKRTSFCPRRVRPLCRRDAADHAPLSRR